MRKEREETSLHEASRLVDNGRAQASSPDHSFGSSDLGSSDDEDRAEEEQQNQEVIGMHEEKEDSGDAEVGYTGSAKGEHTCEDDVRTDLVAISDAIPTGGGKPPEPPKDGSDDETNECGDAGSAKGVNAGHLETADVTMYARAVGGPASAKPPNEPSLHEASRLGDNGRVKASSSDHSFDSSDLGSSDDEDRADEQQNQEASDESLLMLEDQAETARYKKELADDDVLRAKVALGNEQRQQEQHAADQADRDLWRPGWMEDELADGIGCPSAGTRTTPPHRKAKRHWPRLPSGAQWQRW